MCGLHCGLHWQMKKIAIILLAIVLIDLIRLSNGRPKFSLYLVISRKIILRLIDKC